MTFTGLDLEGGTVSETLSILVVEVNRSPVLTSIGNQTVDEGQTLTLILSGTDPDGDPLSYSAAGIPLGASLADSGFTWTPGFDQAGTYEVTFRVSDGQGGTDEDVISVRVGQINRSPVLALVGDWEVDEGMDLTLRVGSSDPDGDSVFLLVSGNPLW